ncbi:restriction endonuclease subunit S [Limnospira fusiformis KN01]|uniref:restriction endonuclease subunit S n=1 Tax=Limnospira fusiformis TaxID=54297 RepID=UPI001F30A801|nr:restriction endonuclease subunit S [Limnospira fusiformis]ULB45797.1 restriction endonuclease subunit S [Limnospira fusiformis KN01]
MNFIKTATNYHDLSSMPLGWKKSYVKYLGNYINGYPFKPDNWSFQGKPILRIQNLSNPNADFNRYEGEISEAYLVHKGDILISWSASLGVYKWLGEDAWLNQHIFKVEINTKLVFEEYFVWLASWFIKELEHKAHGSTMQHLTWNAFGNFPVLLPPMPEQKAIAHYLDKETAKIDQLIEAKKRLLELLDEKRRALITHAVTRGLNPDVPMRDSGVEWIGEIPKNWEILPLRRILKKMDYGISESVGSEGNIAVLRMGDIDEGEIFYDNVGFVDDVDHDLILTANDLLFNRTNSLDKIGKVAIFRNNYSFPVSFASYLVRMRCNDSVIPEYLNYLLNSLPVLTWAKSNALPAIGQVNLNPNRYSYVNIPIPPIEEQLNIKTYINAKIKQIKKLCSSSEETIKLLQERRTSLITAAVTGQLKIS